MRYGGAERTLLLGGAALAAALLPGCLVPGLVVLVLLWAVNGAGQAMVAVPSVRPLAEHAEPERCGQTSVLPPSS